MTESSLRRSSRRVKKQTYSVGDIVEIAKNDGDKAVTKGRLISKLTTESASLHRWQVGFDDESWPEEDLYESQFGEILGKAAPTSNSPSATTSARGRKATSSSLAATTSRKPNNKKPDAVSASVTPENKSNNGASRASTPPSLKQSGKNGKTSKNKKRVAFEDMAAVPATDSLSSSSLSPTDDKRAPTVSAREQRSKRRQAQQSPPPDTAPVRPNKKAKNAKQKEDVVRIPMLTGTLFLYRGPNRRAEFVRKV